MSGQTVLTGPDLSQFKNLVQQGLSGDLGDIDRIEVTRTEAGQLILATNGFQSEPMGFDPQTAQTCPVCGQVTS